MEFANKGYLFLLLLIIPYVLWYFLKRRRAEPTMRMSDTYAYLFAPKSWKVRLVHLPMLLRILTFTMVVLVLARPQTHNARGTRTVEGIDIMLAMDVSTSMELPDLRPNRLEAAKSVAAEFVAGRPDDNIGLTVFAGESFTKCPMTTDHATLLNQLNDLHTDIAARGVIEDGTAIGMGLANAVNRLKDSKAKSKIVILLTDGSNNRGEISPLTAAEIAKKMGVRVYTICVGTDMQFFTNQVVVGGMVQTYNQPVSSTMDEKTLKEIAKTTDGNFYRATNNAELKQIYKDIDQLEKTKFKETKFTVWYDDFQPFVWVAIISLLLEILLRNTVLRRIP